LAHANVLFALRDVDRWTDSEVYQHFGPPKIAPLRFIDGSIPQPTGPRQITEAISFNTINPELLSGDICIIDFGLSFRTKSPPPGIPGTPRSFLAPELCFGLPRSPSNDVWSLGCLIFELYSTRVLFPLVFDQLDILIGTIVDTLSQLPSQWEGHFVTQEERVFETGQKDFWYDPSFKPSRPLDRQIIEKCPGIPEDQMPLFLQLLLGTLCLDPVHRLSALEIAAHSWFSQGGDSPEKS
jgi:serine/threonine protein kinase